MAFIPALNTLRVAVQYLSSGGERAVNVQHFRHNAGAISAVAVGDLFDVLDAWFFASWGNTASNQWQTDLFTGTDLTAAEGAQYTRITTVNGTRVAPALPAQNTIAMSLRTGFSGRSRRGRLFHVGLSEDLVTNSTISSAGSTTLTDAYNDLIAQLSATDWDWVVASFYTNKLPRTTALLSPITNVILTDVIVDSMDTRKPRSL